MLSLIAGQEITDVLFRLVRAGVIIGKVVDDMGEPMVGVNVTVLHKLPIVGLPYGTGQPVRTDVFSRRVRRLRDAGHQAG